ncbi:MAG: hypothetical protein JRJ29_04105 [Deltaproteobacteria bacterium]|nr:hypothetical protein [Deltaproteobacteria bacterium]
MESNRKTRGLVRCAVAAYILLGAVLLFSPGAMAHRIYLFAWIEGDVVHTQGYYSGNKAVKGGAIRVFDLDGKELLKGTTDDKGEFSFKMPVPGPLRIVLEEAMGHRTEYVLKPEGLGQGGEDKGPEKKKESSVESRVVKDGLGLDQIRTVLEEVLDKRLGTLERSIARLGQERGPHFRDIIGGLGYIFGLMGVILYFKSRKNR